MARGIKITNLGMPNVYGSRIKRAVEGFWKGKKTEEDIRAAERKVLDHNRALQSRLDLRPTFDIDIYDRLLKTAVLFGLTPSRFGTAEQAAQDLETYLSIPRGTQLAPASPMVKWFNTNYHVVQPEIERAPSLNVNARIRPPALQTGDKLALIGPHTVLSYALNNTDLSSEELFELLSEEYLRFINQLPDTVIQLEEPSFLTQGIPPSYDQFLQQIGQETHLHTYFSDATNIADTLFGLTVDGIGLDFVDGPANLDILGDFPSDKLLIAGIINGRNVWRANSKTKATLEAILDTVPEERLYLSPSCSLQHVPLSAETEPYDFAFAKEKLAELHAIKEGTIEYQQARPTIERLPSQRYERARTQPWTSTIAFPTTTIGSFPQTPSLRKRRRQRQKGKCSQEDYETYLKDYIKECIARQEELGIDVLVHGEPERNDMIQYFAEHFEGFIPIKGKVQSYGTRLLRPPVVVADIRRPKAFTVPWIAYAQSLTQRPVKAMLTGPVTLSQWSFPREDISREAQFYQFAEALKHEADDLARAGITHIQIDEPALREGLPLAREKQGHYLSHAVNAFRRVYCDVPDEVIIHSHMCFSEFPDIIDAIADMGVDVLSIEDSKARGKTARSLHDGGFPASLGLGVYDVHSPRLPRVDEMKDIPEYLIERGFDPRKIWINPDCGLKTRGEEAYAQLEIMVRLARTLRERYPL